MTVIITGVTGGIGKALAEKFCKEANVVGAYFSDKESAKYLEENLGIYCVKTDIRNEKDVENLFCRAREKFGKVDVLINNAGCALKKMVCDTSLDEWQKVIDVNLKGTFLASRSALKDMMYSGGTIINISSVYGLSGGSCEAAYSAAKAGVIGLTKAMAKEYQNVRINCVCPGAVDTKMNDNLTNEEKQALNEEIPAGRMARPEEIADAVYFLSKQEYITGEILSVNGGMYI